MIATARAPALTIGALTAPLLPSLTELVRSILAASIARDPDEDLDAIIRDIQAGRAIAWAANDGPVLLCICVTEIHETASGKQCFIRHLAGSRMNEWLWFLDKIEAWARSIGCRSMELVGREGFERLLGWRRKAVLLRKDL